MRTGNHLSSVIVSLVLFVLGPEALACPMCHTGTGTAVRAGIFNGGDFFYNLLVVLTPFAVLGVVVACIYKGPPWGIRGERIRKYGKAS